MPGKTARALCPVCQEPMPPDETECENCGAFVIDEAVVRLCRAFGIPREKALALFDKGFRHPTQLKDRNVDDVLQRGENGLLFLCTNCGGFVATGDPKCPRCGAEFEAEEPAPEEKDILDLVLCPVCGADNEPVWRECEICGEPLGGTEAPPGEESVSPTPVAEPAPPTAVTPPTPDPEALDRIDDLLEDLKEPATVRRRRKFPKISRSSHAAKPTPNPPRSAPSPLAATTAAPSPPVQAMRVRPTPRRSIRPLPTPVTKPAPAPVPTARRETPPPQRTRPHPPTRGRHRAWTAPPSEFTAGITVAAAASLYLSNELGEVVIAWVVVLALGILALFIVVPTVVRREHRIGRLDALLLASAALLGVAAPVISGTLAPVLAVAGAVPLALATRRLLKTHSRDLVTAAAAVPLMVFGLAVGMGLPFAGRESWILGLVAMVPWPTAVALTRLRSRRSSFALHRELSRAEQDLAHEDYAASVKDFDRAIAAGAKDAPDAEIPWYGKGASLILLGRYDEALRAIDTALDLNPRNEVAWLNKGNALTKMGRLPDALRCFNAALKVNPKYEVAWNNRGNTLARMGHFEEALACYERALAIDPEYRGAWVNKGYVLTKLGRYDEATSCADRALRLHDPARTKAA